MKKCTRICENPRSNYYSTYSRHRCVRALSLHAFLRPGEIKFTDFRRSRDHGRDHRFRKIHANAQCSSFGWRTRRDHVSRLIFPALAPATLQRSLFSFHRDFLSPNSTSPPLFNTESSRVSVSSTILDAFPTLFVHGRGGESEVGIVAPTVNRGKESLSRSNRSREREKKRKRGADFRGIQCPRGGCDCAPLRGTIRGTVREERGGVGGEKREIIAARPSRLLPSQDRT